MYEGTRNPAPAGESRGDSNTPQSVPESPWRFTDRHAGHGPGCLSESPRPPSQAPPCALGAASPLSSRSGRWCSAPWGALSPQAKAPNAVVLVVGTHLDLIESKFRVERIATLRAYVLALCRSPSGSRATGFPDITFKHLQ